MALNFLLKRSGTASKRPVAASMALGEVDINYDASTGGLFYKDSAGSVVKVGPAEVGSTAPNSSPVGSSGNSVGEFWYDTAGSVLKIWNGSSWAETVSTSGFLSTSGGSMTGNLYISNCELQVDSSGIFTSIGTATFSGTTELNGTTSFFFTPTWLENIGPASQVTYDNTTSGLTATEVQGAVDELEGLTAAAQADATQALTDASAAQSTANAAIAKSVLSTAGDLLYASAASTPERLGVGANGQYLTVQSGLPAWTNFPLTGYTGASNTGYGQGAGDSITSGVLNVTAGLNAGTSLDVGSRNIAIGGGAMAVATSAANNVSIGNNSLASMTSGAGNVAIGGNTGLSLTTGGQNVYVGLQAGQGNTASLNTFLGNQAGASLTGATAANSVFVGYRSGTSITTGNTNTFLGYTAGDAVTTGSNNTIIGDFAGSAALANNLVLAAGSTIKLQVNENGAVGVGPTPSYGTTNQVLTSNGTGAAATWNTLAWLNANRVTTTSTSPTQIFGLNMATRRGAVFNLAVVDTTGGSYWIDTWTVIHDGTSATLTLTAAGAHIGPSPYTLNPVVSSGIISIQATSSTANTTTYDFAYQLFNV